MNHKPIVYTCGGLMLAAAVFGVVDYAGATKQGIFKNLYKDDETQAGFSFIKSQKNLETKDFSREAIGRDYVERKLARQEKANIKTAVSKFKKENVEEQDDLVKFTPPEIIEEDVFYSVNSNTEPDTIPVTKVDEPELKMETETVDSVTAVPKKLSMRMFSRAPIYPKKKSPKYKKE